MDLGTRVEPPTKPVAVAPRRNASRSGAAGSRVDARKAAAAPAAHTAAAVARLRSSGAANDLGAGAAGGDEAAASGVGAVDSALPDAASAAKAQSGTEMTAPASMRMVRRAASAAPSLSTSGSKTRLGTKKMGSHLAMRPQPGLAASNIPSARRGATKRTEHRPPKRIMEPARDDGKLTARAMKIILSTASAAMIAPSEKAALTEAGAARGGDGDGAAAAEHALSERERST
mmetsp:Transcript_13541/g.44210  ORF Transcript_13541/g.44210 Transcript_13541/m.44210 type:complete len:231 (-) Transcript_13541:152-844(-)